MESVARAAMRLYALGERAKKGFTAWGWQKGSVAAEEWFVLRSLSGGEAPVQSPAGQMAQSSGGLTRQTACQRMKR
jgi:hypothetical protein